jgi:hypothetical protein
MLPVIAAFVSGVITLGFAVCAGFFLRFWGRTKDALFLAFAIAFLLLALSQALTTILGLPQEERSWLFLLRLAAFSIIIAAVLRKNIRR